MDATKMDIEEKIDFTGSFDYKTMKVLTERPVKKNCNRCHGTGYTCTLVRYQPKLKTGPNSKCLCNSGKKFKHCHMEEAETFRRQGSILVTCECAGKAKVELTQEERNMLQDYIDTTKENLQNAEG